MAYTERYVTSGAGGGGDGSSGNPWNIVEATGNAAAGDRVNIQSDATYTLVVIGDVLTFPAGANENPIEWRGYNSSIGDLEDVGRTGTAALTTTNFPLLDGGGLVEIVYSSFSNFKNLRFTSSRDGKTVSGSATNATFWRCSMENTHATGVDASAFFGTTAYGKLCDCDLTSATNGAASIVADAQRTSVIGCRIWSTVGSFGAATSALFVNLGASAIGNIVYNSARGITARFANLIGYNTIYDCNDGVYFNNVDVSSLVVNNIIYSMGSYAFDGAQGASTFLWNNAAGDLNAGRINTGALGTTIEENDPIVLTADPFTDAASGDFTLNPHSGGGVLCRSASQFFTGNHDLGAVQRVGGITRFVDGGLVKS